jgi:hypothetical protein
MRELRAALDDNRTQPLDRRASLRALAAEWPGALRELDTLPTDEIERRLDACAAGADEPWMAWMLRYHELMRAALAIRRGERPAVDEAFARAVRRPQHGRLNVVVFAALGRELGVAPRQAWDTLFPPRGRARRDYRS